MPKIDRGFRCLPAYTRSPVPCSDYILDVLRPEIDRLLFLGETYERFFDDLEMISALVYADITEHQSGRFWAAPGRFAYKSRSSTGPMQSFITDAASKGEDMPFLKIGLFSSSVTRFEQTTKANRNEVIPIKNISGMRIGTESIKRRGTSSSICTVFHASPVPDTTNL
jgi:hypothetical protein